MVSVSGEGSRVAGTSYSLTCRVKRPLGMFITPNIQWKRPNMLVTSASNKTTTDAGDQATLQLPSLLSSDAGEYLCQASYSLGGYTSPLVNGSFILNVIGKFPILTTALIWTIYTDSTSTSTDTTMISSTYPTAAITMVTAGDPVDPVRPEEITFMDVKSDSVIIQWTVAYISYSPETYVVQYGTSRDSLIHNSRSTDSEEGEMMSYSVELSGLRDNTTYYVQVLATNTAQRSNRSCVLGLTTLSAINEQTGIELCIIQ